MLSVDQIKEILAGEAADEQRHQRVQQQRHLDAGDAPSRQPLRKSPVTTAPVKVRTVPVLIAEATGDNLGYASTAGEIEYGTPQVTTNQPTGNGSTALDMLLADRRAEDLKTNQYYGTTGEKPAYALARILLWIFFVVMFVLLQILHHR
ncbi:MAG TPA: hypothetical protein V6D22_23210 [Candidatus Obscuribacterales bacterium]